VIALLVALAASPPLAPRVEEGLRTDARLEVIVVGETCTSPRCLSARAERERVRFLFWARADGEEVDVRVYDHERKASLSRRATLDGVAAAASALARAALASPDARARVIVLDPLAEGAGPDAGVITAGGILVLAAGASAVGAICGANALVLDRSAREGGITQRDAFTRFDERDSAALCANLGWVTAGLTGVLGGAILAQRLGWSE
jgi:hypothetical protein